MAVTLPLYDFGEYSYLISIIGFGSLCDLGIALYSQIYLLGALNLTDVCNVFIKRVIRICKTSIVLIGFLVSLLIVVAIYIDCTNLIKWLIIPFFMTCYASQQIITRILYSYGFHALVNTASYVSPILQILFVAIVPIIYDGPQSAPLYVSIYYTISFFTIFIAFKKSSILNRNPSNKPELNFEFIKSLTRNSIKFFFPSLAWALCVQFDLVAIGYIFGLKFLASYTILQKIFFGVVFSLILNYINISYSKCFIANRDSKDTLNKLLVVETLKITCFITFSIFFFEIFKVYIIETFASNAYLDELSNPWVYLFYLYFFLRCINELMHSYYYACNKVQLLTKLITLQSMSYLALVLPAGFVLGLYPYLISQCVIFLFAGYLLYKNLNITSK
ncbi:MAG: hypothetical protein EoVTN8_414 [Fluviibacter phosphoraccumulans EoVTN8]